MNKLIITFSLLFFLIGCQYEYQYINKPKLKINKALIGKWKHFATTAEKKLLSEEELKNLKYNRVIIKKNNKYEYSMIMSEPSDSSDDDPYLLNFTGWEFKLGKHNIIQFTWVDQEIENVPSPVSCMYLKYELKDGLLIFSPMNIKVVNIGSFKIRKKEPDYKPWIDETSYSNKVKTVKENSRTTRSDFIQQINENINNPDLFSRDRDDILILKKI